MAVAATAGSTENLHTRWVLGSVPEKPAGGGYPLPKVSDFKAIREPIPSASDIKDGHVLIKHYFLSADPYVVAYRMTKPDHVGQTIWAGAAGKVVESKSKNFSAGDIVVGGGMCGSAEYSVNPEGQLDKVLFDSTKVPLSLSLGLLGMPGCTAYFGVTDLLGADLTGKTVVVTGAAGAVGSAAGQIAKLVGATTVIGLCGSAAKVERCLNKYNYDKCLNYKSPTLADELKALAPFHCFYDNTGGPAATLIKALMVDGGPVAKVGNIGGASSDEHHHRLKIKGFYAGGVKAKWPTAIKNMAAWVEAGKLHYDETVLVGIDSIPSAFIGQRTGKNTGKMIVDLTQSAKRVMVTGGNSGIGFALCRQLAADHGCHVYLGSRSVDKGQKAVAAITSAHPGVKVELIQIDVSSDDSVKAAAAKIKATGQPLHGVVNNAGTGLAHPGVTVADVLNVNLSGVKRVCEAFLPLLDQKSGRFVNVGSGAGPMYIHGRFKSALTAEERKQLANPDITWPQIQAVVAKENAAGLQPHTAYGLSKAALHAYTATLARDHGHITSSSCTPGFIQTAIVKVVCERD